MCWVESVESHDDHCLVHADIKPDHILATGDGVDAMAGAEFMAQAVAASITHRHPERAEFIGFLLGIKHFKYAKPLLGFGRYDIEVRDELIFFDAGIGTFNTRMLLDGLEVASGQIKAFLANEESQQQPVLDGKL